MTARIGSDKVWFPKWFVAIVVSGSIGFVATAVGVGIAIGGMSQRLAQTEDHCDDPVVHMPYSQKVEIFWTRIEGEHLEVLLAAVDARQRAVSQSLARIEERLEALK